MNKDSDKTGIVIIEENQPVREGWEIILKANPAFVLHGSYKGIKEALTNISVSEMLIFLIGLEKNFHQLDAMKKMFLINPKLIFFVFVNNEDEEDIINIIAAGAAGIMEKKVTPLKFVNSLISAADGSSPISPGIAKEILSYFDQYVNRLTDIRIINKYERQILERIAAGNSSSSTAAMFEISELSLGKQIRNIYKILFNHYNINNHLTTKVNL